jgi:hypothetical protein
VESYLSDDWFFLDKTAENIDLNKINIRVADSKIFTAI